MKNPRDGEIENGESQIKEGEGNGRCTEKFGIEKWFRMAVAALAAYLTFRFLLPMFLPFCIAGLLAILLYPAARLLHRALKFPIFASGALVLFLFCSTMILGLFYLGRALVTQLIAFFQNFAVYEAYLAERVDGICMGCDRIFRLKEGTVMEVLESAMTVLVDRVQSDILPALTAKTLRFAAGTAAIFGVVLIVLVSTLLMIKDMEEYRNSLKKLKEYPVPARILSGLTGGAAAYLKTQLILFLVISAVLSIGFFLLKNPYALVFGLGIAIFDAFPVLGSGLILVPWAVVHLLAENYFQAVVLLLLYLICQVIREVVEPKLLGGKLGIRPVVSMMSIYVGIRLFGVPGVILGPLGLIIIMGAAG